MQVLSNDVTLPMPLIGCPDCNKQVSDSATTCPHCGYPINSVRKEQKPVVATKRKSSILVVLFFIVMIVIVINNAYEEVTSDTKPSPISDTKPSFNIDTSAAAQTKRKDLIKIYRVKELFIKQAHKTGLPEFM